LRSKYCCAIPRVGPGQAGAERQRRLPAQHLPDERVVAVAPGHAARRIEIVLALQRYLADLLGQADQGIDRNQLARPQIDRRRDQFIAMHDRVDAQHAFVDVHEAARLAAVAPDGDLMPARVFGFDDLAANSGGRFLPPAIPGANRAIDVMKARE